MRVTNRFASTAYMGRPPANNKLPVELSTRVPVGIVTLRGRTLGPVSRLFIEHARAIWRLGQSGQCAMSTGNSALLRM